MDKGILRISLAAARTNAKMTQSEVAEKLRVSKTSVVNWENGKTMPSFVVLNALAELYEIPLDNIFLPTEAT